MSLSTNTTYRFLVEKLGSSDPNQFIGNEGEVFYDPSVPTLKLSDGSTAGGLTIAGGGGGSVALDANNNFIVGGGSSIGTYNNFIGVGAGSSTTTGSYNNFFGDTAGKFNTTGSTNNFFGESAGYHNTTGSANQFIGRNAGTANTTGYYNSFFGQGSGFNNTTGVYNSFFGAYSGSSNISGNYNVSFGHNTGISTSASYRVIIGSSQYNQNFDAPDTDKDNQFAVGVRTDANPANYWLVGDENFNVGIGTTNPTSKLTVQSGDIRVGVNTSQGVILTDANGVSWRLIVNTNGTLATVAI